MDASRRAPGAGRRGRRVRRGSGRTRSGCPTRERSGARSGGARRQSPHLRHPPCHRLGFGLRHLRHQASSRGEGPRRRGRSLGASRGVRRLLASPRRYPRADRRPRAAPMAGKSGPGRSRRGDDSRRDSPSSARRARARRAAPRPGALPHRRLLLLIQDCGAEALPIVTLISFLVGLILAFVGAVQLQRFGAADLRRRPRRPSRWCARWAR